MSEISAKHFGSVAILTSGNSLFYIFFKIKLLLLMKAIVDTSNKLLEVLI